MDEPGTPAQLATFLDYLGMDDRILFATDYPHWDFDDPVRVFPPTIDAERRKKFFSGNAERLFGLARP
jgi:predicted TIM-barrel fold metal-dependent hydrolase